MQNFEVHSNKSACRKKVRLGLEQVFTTHVGVTATNLLVSVMTGSFDCCLCGYIIAQRLIIPFLPKCGNSHGNITEIPSLHVIIGEC